jgi:citrate lyase subunit beta/citryl-CoA lyase
VAILNEEYAPQAGDVAHAERVVAAYKKAMAEGVGAITVDGKMIDVPVVERAQALLARHRAITAPEAKLAR